MDKLSELQAFHRVAELGSFRAAANALGLTASAVSKQVKALEDRLGARLFHRTTRRVSLTEDGRALDDRIGPLLAELEDAEQRVAQRQGRPRGPLRIGAPMDFGRAHLAGPIARFAAEFPEITLEVDFSDRFVDLVEEGLDVVVRIGTLGDSSHVVRRLAPCRQVVCASPAYLAEHGRPAEPRALARHGRIVYAYEAERSWQFETARGRERVRVPMRHKSNNGALSRELVLAGLGLALLPTFLVADDLRAGRLVSLFSESLRHDIAIHALYPHRRHLSARVRKFVDHLAAHCGPQPYWDEGLDLGREPAAGARGH